MSYNRIFEEGGMSGESKLGYTIDNSVPKIEDKNKDKKRCLYCKKYIDKEKYDSHILKDHRYKVTLFIDGENITNQNKIIKHRVSEAYFNLHNKNINIYINNKKIDNTVNKKKIDVTDNINEELKDHDCLIEFDNKKITIELKKINDLNMDLLDEKILLMSNDMTTSLKLKENYFYENISDYEKNYLEGCYNYFLGCKTKIAKKDRYDDAYGILSHFKKNTKYGDLILKVICFNRNEYDKLNEMNKLNDSFKLISDIIDLKENINIENYNLNLNIFIEDDILRCINSFIDYAFKRYDKVKEFIDYYKFIDVDLKLQCKIYFLSALIEFENNNIKNFRHIINEIDDDYLKNKLIEYMEMNL